MASRNSTKDAYQIKITLRGSKPPIWCRFLVPSNIRLDDLHHVIQAVMGWHDEHLHDFAIRDERYTAKSMYGMALESDGLEERKFCLGQLIEGSKSKFVYQDDFGDSWEHTLLVEKVIAAAENPPVFTCLTGSGRCPPEDCGGIYRYYHMLQTLNDPKNPEHDDLMDWGGGKIDPHEFDLDAINKALAFFHK